MPSGRRIICKLLYWTALPFGWLQRDCAELLRACLRLGYGWLPLTLLPVAVLLPLWMVSRGIFTVLFLAMKTAVAD